MSLFDALVEKRDSALYDVLEVHNRAFSALLDTQLKLWNVKYKRHSFKAYEGHGMLTIHCNPPLMGQHDSGSLGYINVENTRGAIKALLCEIRGIIDLYNDTDFNVSICYYNTKMELDE